MSEALEKLKYYCAYQERCHSEVRTKLLNLKVYGSELENIITALIDEDFLNEERFAQAYCRGKFYYKQWGRNKIVQSLKLKQVSDYCIRKGLKEIDEIDYKNTIEAIIEQKKQQLASEKNVYVKKSKIFQYLFRKGYESSLISSSLDILL